MYPLGTTELIKNSSARNDTEDSQRKMSGSQVDQNLFSSLTKFTRLSFIQFDLDLLFLSIP